MSLIAAIQPVPLDAGWEPRRGHPLTVEIASVEMGLEEFTWDIVWDRDGVAYLARERIWRWDGTTLEPIGPDIFSEMHAIAFDREERLLVGGINEFGIYDPRSDRYESLMKRVPPEHRQFGRAWAIHDDGDAIWMGSNNRLFRIGSGSTEVHLFEGKHRVLFHFLESGVYAHETDVGLWKIEGDRKELINDNPQLSSEIIILLVEHDNDTLMALSINGISYISSLNYEIESFYPQNWENLQVSCAQNIGSNVFAVGTLEGKIFFANGNGEVFGTFSERNAISGHIILNLRLDEEGNLWSIENDRVRKFLLQFPCTVLDENQNYPTGYIRDYKVVKNGLYLAVEEGVFFHDFRNGLNSDIEQIHHGVTNSIAALGNNIVFDRYSKVLVYENSSISLLHEFDREIWTLTTVGDRVVVGFSDRIGVYRLFGDRNLELLWEHKLPWGLRLLEADASGVLWGWDPLGPLLELRWEESGGFREIWHETVGGISLREERRDFAMTEDGPVLLMGDRIGRHRLQGGGWEVAELELPDGALEATTFHYAGDVLEGWLVSWDPEIKSHLLTELRWEAGSPPTARRLPWIGMRELGRIKTIAHFEDENGPQLMISGLKGVVFADRSLTDEIPVPSRPVVYHDGRRLWGEREIAADYGENVLSFRYSSPGGGSYYPVRYQTRLSGRDAGWSEPSVLPYRELGQLWEGRYAFEVRALDPFGRTSPVATVGLRIYPPWFRTPWAMLLYLLAALLLGFLIYRLQGRKLLRRQAWLEGEVKLRTLELERANQFKDDFIANLSHEIRNPLNGVIGSIYQLKAEEALPERTLKSLRGAAHYLQTTVEEVLDFAKLESGEIRIEESAFDLSEIVGGILEIHRPAALGKGLSLTTRIRIPEGMAVVSDARKIQQVIGNLVGNAVKFTEAGNVTVGITLKPEKLESGTLRIWVEDSGAGIPVSEQERIFEKFYQGQGGTLKTPGTGIGLALVKTFVECLGGQLELKSEPGKGSTFIVNLRVGLQPLAESGEAMPEDKRYEGIRILIVEDLEYNRTILEDFLGDLGCITESADNGRDGFEKARTGAFGVILLDWELPEKSGLEVARDLRADPAFPRDTLIVGMTAYATAEDQQACLDAGMDVFLSKPISHRQLLEILDRVASRGALLEGLGLLSEMSQETDVNATLERWAGFHTTYRGELEEAIAGGDAQAIRKAAHRLLGHLRMLELTRLPGVVADLMTAAQAGDLRGVDQEWQVLAPLLEQLDREIREWMNKA